MQSQVGDLAMDKDGIAGRGLLIRLLALPGGISGTAATLKFIREHISKSAYLSVMSQYYPTFKAYDYPVLSRGVNAEEYNNVVDEARLLGLNNGWIQDSPEPFDGKFFGTNIIPGGKAEENGKEDK
jgi:putative pyruvate formate lyase activating enzyme